jgi:hypothetical protein
MGLLPKKRHTAKQRNLTKTHEALQILDSSLPCYVTQALRHVNSIDKQVAFAQRVNAHAKRMMNVITGRAHFHPNIIYRLSDGTFHELGPVSDGSYYSEVLDKNALAVLISSTVKPTTKLWCALAYAQSPDAGDEAAHTVGICIAIPEPGVWRIHVFDSLQSSKYNNIIYDSMPDDSRPPISIVDMFLQAAATASRAMFPAVKKPSVRWVNAVAAVAAADAKKSTVQNMQQVLYRELRSVGVRTGPALQAVSGTGFLWAAWSVYSAIKHGDPMHLPRGLILALQNRVSLLPFVQAFITQIMYDLECVKADTNLAL